MSSWFYRKINALFAKGFNSKYPGPEDPALVAPQRGCGSIPIGTELSTVKSDGEGV
jgi:hypothetical protein